MSILDIFFINRPKNSIFYNRKLELPSSGSFNLYGARGVGKSALIVDWLKELDKNSYLYIDAEDPKFILDDIDIIELNSFIKEESIKTLIIDHYFDGFLEDVPTVDRYIIVSRYRIDIVNRHYKLLPLDFEEFFSFSKFNSIETAFSKFTKHGTLPSIVVSGINSFASREYFFEKFEPQIGKVVLILSMYQCQIATNNQIYKRAKDYFRISKDQIYNTIKELIDEEVVYTIENYEKGFGKKIILYDFAIAKYLNGSLNYQLIFDSIIAVALLKHNIKIKAISKPYGYVTDKSELILVSPLEEEEELWTKIQKNFSIYSKLRPIKVTIITNSSSYSFNINKIEFTALPFYEWVTGLN